MRSRVAQHGEEALAAVRPWLSDRDLYRLAARVIWKADELGHKDARQELERMPVVRAL
jgi:hypothetical protein